MTSEEDESIISEVRELYEAVVKQASKGPASNEADPTIGSLNCKVLEEVSQTVKEPLLDLMKSATTSVETSRGVASSILNLPGPMTKEVTGIPEALDMGNLSEGLPSTVRGVIDAMNAAASDPSILYPRLLCGSIPVDPAKVGRLAKKYNAQDLIDGPAEENGNVRSRSGSSAEVITQISRSFTGVAEPLMKGLESLKAINSKFGETAEVIRSFEGAGDEFQDLISKQDEVTGFAERLTSLLSPDDPGSPVTTDSRDINIQRTEDNEKNCIQLVEEGSQFVRRAQEFQEPIERATEKARAVVQGIGSLGTELKELFKLAVGVFQNIVDLLKRFVSNLPSIVGEIKKFFIPTGLRSLVMHPSQDLLNLVDGIEKLKEVVPDPEELESKARRVLDESESASSIANITSKMTEVAGIQVEIVEKLAVLGTELPRKIVSTAREAVKRWIEGFGEDFLEEKIEDGIQDIAEKIGGEQLVDVVDNLLPFRSNDSNDQNDSKSTFEGGLGGMLKSFF